MIKQKCMYRWHPSWEKTLLESRQRAVYKSQHCFYLVIPGEWGVRHKRFIVPFSKSVYFDIAFLCLAIRPLHPHGLKAVLFCLLLYYWEKKQGHYTEGKLPFLTVHDPLWDLLTPKNAFLPVGEYLCHRIISVCLPSMCSTIHPGSFQISWGTSNSEDSRVLSSL